MNLNRRKFLGQMSASAMSLATMSTLSTGLTSFASHAQTAQEYKALVCVFLLGGMDSHDLIIPYDTLSYNQYAAIRAPMLNDYGASRQRSALLPLIPAHSNNLDSRQFAMPPEMPNIHQLFQQGNAAIIGNVGPLIEPTTKTQMENGSVPLPSRLFSHNDQQATWQSGGPEGSQFGWGGLFADLLQHNNQNQEFTNIATHGNSLFLAGASTFPYRVSTSGASKIELLELLDESFELNKKLENHFANELNNQSNLLERDVTQMNADAYASNQKFEQAFQSPLALTTEFPGGPLSSQLQTVATTIANRKALGVSRQVFFVALGGFDTHDNQAASLPGLLGQIDNSIFAFQQAMIELGLHDQVTLFSASDFGRTLAVNGDGTDHGWGSHHLVIGGAVKGQQIYGQIPPASIGHELDVGNGRLIPSISVEQMAAPLGRWFGLSENELNAALPNLKNFADQNIGFI